MRRLTLVACGLMILCIGFSAGTCVQEVKVVEVPVELQPTPQIEQQTTEAMEAPEQVDRVEFETSEPLLKAEPVNEESVSSDFDTLLKAEPSIDAVLERYDTSNGDRALFLMSVPELVNDRDSMHRRDALDGSLTSRELHMRLAATDRLFRERVDQLAIRCAFQFKTGEEP